jgi:hypothetical protein
MSRSKDAAGQKTIWVILAHIVVILFAYSSPLWLDWKLITLGIALYYLQILIFGGCILSLAQFKGEKKSFHEWYLTQLGFSVDSKKLTFFLNKILPFIFLVTALILQVGLDMHPFVNIR